MGKDSDDGFVGRWARRKEAARNETPEPIKEPDRAEVEALENLEAMPEAEALQKLGLPDPDTLSIGDDFKQFLGKSVPHKIKRRAMRRLWTSNPVLANLDGLNDYDEDFTNAATDAVNLVTSYVVGEGFVPRVKPSETEDEESSVQEETQDIEVQSSPDSEMTMAEKIDEHPQVNPGLEEPSYSTPDLSEDEVVMPDEETEISQTFVRRRMQFTIGDS